MCRSRTGERKIAAFAIILAVLVTVSCTGISGPEVTVKHFIAPFNDKNVNTMLSCIDPRQEQLFRATFHIVEKLSGIPVEDLLEMLPGLAQLAGQSASQDIRFEETRVVRKEVSHETAYVTISTTVIKRAGNSVQREQAQMQFRLTKFDEQGWRITGVAPGQVRH